MKTFPSQAEYLFEDGVVEHREFRDQANVVFTSVKSSFISCRFTNVAMDQATFGGGRADSLYSGCIFSDVRVCARAPGYARFERCIFENVVFTELFAFGIEFVDCRFSGEFSKGFLNGRVPERAQEFLGRSLNQIRGNDFRRQRFGDFDFRTGVDLSLQQLPTGEQYLVIYDAPAKLERIHQQLSRVDGRVLKAMTALLRVMEGQVRDGQRDFFFNLANETDEDRTVLEHMRRVVG